MQWKDRDICPKCHCQGEFKRWQPDGHGNFIAQFQCGYDGECWGVEPPVMEGYDNDM